MTMPPLVLRAKCILVGDSAVGKTAVAQSFISDGSQFPKLYQMGTGVDISVKPVHIPNTDVTVEFVIYDCAGKETFLDFIQQYWDNVGVALVVYDVTNQSSFSSCSKWLNRIIAKKSSPDSVLLGCLVANRIDLDSQRVVTSEEGQRFAAENGFDYVETSAKSHKNCKTPFQDLAVKYYKMYLDKMEEFSTLL